MGNSISTSTRTSNPRQTSGGDSIKQQFTKHMNEKNCYTDIHLGSKKLKENHSGQPVSCSALYLVIYIKKLLEFKYRKLLVFLHVRMGMTICFTYRCATARKLLVSGSRRFVRKAYKCWRYLQLCRRTVRQDDRTYFKAIHDEITLQIFDVI